MQISFSATPKYIVGLMYLHFTENIIRIALYVRESVQFADAASIWTNKNGYIILANSSCHTNNK